jgi:tRNA dimethylallyltransferase
MQIAAKEAEVSKATGEDERAARKLMHDWLSEIDPETASALHPNDISRTRRALGVSLSFNTSLRELQAKHAHRDCPYRALVLVMTPEREELYEAINTRVDLMFELGLVDEVKALLKQYPKRARAFGSIGYSQILKVLNGELSESEARELIKRDTRRYAKRQYTWWRNQPETLGWREVPGDGLSAEYNKAVLYLSEVLELFLTPERDYATEGIAFLRVPALNRGAKST